MQHRLDDEGPGSYEEILEYIEAAIRDNCVMREDAMVTAVRESKETRLARAMLTSILARMDVVPGQQKTVNPARPDDGLCTATIDDPQNGLQRCAQPAGHYNGDDEPDMLAGDDDPRGWHQSEKDAAGNSMTWADWSIHATPHGSPNEELVDAGGHDFQWDDDHLVQRCTRCTLPHPRWAGGPCPGHPLRPGEYV